MNPWSLTVMPAMDRLAEVLIWRRRELGDSIFTYEALFDMAQQILGRAFGPNWLSIIKSVLFVIFSFTSQVQEQSNYRPHAEAALTTLQQWYNQSSGLWDTTGWWNSANCLTVLADFAAIDSYAASVGDRVFPNTLGQAQKYNLQLQKVMVGSSIRSYYGAQWPYFPPGMNRPAPVMPVGFLNGYYDDEGWWALGWIRVYDVTGGRQYLQTAINIFDDMTGGWNSSRCGGGIWWDKAHTYENAIANELFISVAAHLANRATGNSAFYRNWALKSWAWFQQSGMINAGHTINDGLTLATCQNNGGTVWSYNQGVILGGLVELNKAAPNQSYISEAQAIANAAIASLTDTNGVLHDPCEPNCGADGSQFKGIFMRNVQVLQEAAPSSRYRSFLDANAEAVWADDRSNDNELSVVWSGPFVVPANASTQSSALDALVAAVAVQ
jgi:predicted alpha-1,6-mannanase (GH76 family)